MLRKEDFVYYGKFLKPHGTKGEIGLQGDNFTLGDDCDFVACDICVLCTAVARYTVFEYSRQGLANFLADYLALDLGVV